MAFYGVQIRHLELPSQFFVHHTYGYLLVIVITLLHFLHGKLVAH